MNLALRHLCVRVVRGLLWRGATSRHPRLRVTRSGGYALRRLLADFGTFVFGAVVLGALVFFDLLAEDPAVIGAHRYFV